MRPILWDTGGIYIPPTIIKVHPDLAFASRVAKRPRVVTTLKYICLRKNTDGLEGGARWCDEPAPSTVRWGPDAVPRNCRWAVPVVAPVGRIRRRLAPSVTHKNEYVRDKIRERERRYVAHIWILYCGYHAAVIFSVMAISGVR